MRYAIISDIHANRQALKAVLTDIQGIGAEKIICLGDLVGYGPCPEEVLETAYSRIHHFVLGNHDAVVCGKMSSDLFNDRARKIIDWTVSVLNEKASRFFKSVPLVLVGNDFRCTHGEFQDPGRFGYIIDEKEASESFASCSEKILFAGHSHSPCIFVIGESKIPHLIESQDFIIEDEKRYIVNAGSVGQPRDNDIRASYCIFDTSQQSVMFRKVPFDIDSYCADLQKRKIPESASYFIGIYRNQPVQPIRDILDFGRVKAEDAVRTAADVKNLEETVKSLRKTVIILVLLFLLVGGATATGIYKYVEHSENTKQELSVKNIEKENELTQKTVELSRTESELSKFKKTIYIPTGDSLIKDFKPDQELVSMPKKVGKVSHTHPAGIWTVTVTNPEQQTVTIETINDKKYGEINVFRIVSNEPTLLEIASAPVDAKAGMRFTSNCQMRQKGLETGFVGIYLEEELGSGVKKILEQNIPELGKYTSKWTSGTSVTILKKDPILEAGKLRFVIRGQFKGEIFVRNCSLKEKNK